MPILARTVPGGRSWRLTVLGAATVEVYAANNNLPVAMIFAKRDGSFVALDLSGEQVDELIGVLQQVREDRGGE